MEHEVADTAAKTDTSTNTKAHIGKQLFLEQAAAFYDDMKAAASNAPYGQVIDKTEAFAVVQCH